MADMNLMKTEFGNPFEGKYNYKQFDFEGKTAYIIFPPEGKSNNKWVLKTEYFGCFPDLEMHLLDKGFHVAGVHNRGRWFALDDVEHQANFIREISEKYGLSKKCVPIGMSAGGGMALMLAGTHPELLSAMYLDAAVYNLLSSPYGYGNSCIRKQNPEVVNEISVYYGKSPEEMLAYRKAPIDYQDAILKERIPAVFVYGTADYVVPYKENTGILAEQYEKKGINKLEIRKEGCDHHPHGVTDDTEVIEFIEKYA